MRNRIEDMFQSNQRQVNLILLGTLQSSAVTCMHALPNWYYTPTAPRTCVEYIVHLCTIHSMLPNCTQEADSLPFWGTGLLRRQKCNWWHYHHSEMKKHEDIHCFHLLNVHLHPDFQLTLKKIWRSSDQAVWEVGYILVAKRCNRTYFPPLTTRFFRKHNALLPMGNIWAKLEKYWRNILW